MSIGPILVISGTNRPQSYALKVAGLLEQEYRALQIPVEVLALTELPMEVFAGEAYQTKPAEMVAIQKRVLEAGGLHIVTPEYNGSFPGVLKYFIDMLQFPESFEGKCVAFVGEALGSWGGLRSVEQLIQIFGYRNALIYPDRVFIPNVAGKFGADGQMTDEAIHKRLKKQAAGFAKYVATLKAAG
jgi:chromate reductase